MADVVIARPARPTVLDVARVADVAVGTVSRVLNTPEAVRADIRTRVEEAMKSLNYQRLRQRARGSTTRTVRAKRCGNIGILLLGMDNSLTHLPVITEALHGVELATAAENVNLMLANVPTADRVPAFLANNQVDGVIIKSPLLGDFQRCVSPELVAAIKRVPHVWLIGLPENAEGDVCGADNDTGGRLAAEYLHRRGHRRTGFLHPRTGQTRSEGLKFSFMMYAQRFGMTVQSFEKALSEAVRWPLSAISRPDDVTPLLERWEAMSAASRPTAMLVPADSIAVQLYAALAQRGIQVGRDLSVLSCNHEKPLVVGLSPSLTTIDIRAEALGRHAVEQLFWRIQHPNDDVPIRLTVQPRLVEGKSVAQLKVPS